MAWEPQDNPACFGGIGVFAHTWKFIYDKDYINIMSAETEPCIQCDTLVDLCKQCPTCGINECFS